MGITMQPVLTTSAPSGGNWRYEAKYDGYRGLLKKFPRPATFRSSAETRSRSKTHFRKLRSLQKA